MKTIALFGASGKTGKELLPKLIEKGYKVKALVRTPSKIKLENEKLSIIEGDVLNEEDVKATIKSADAVISVFGHVKGSPDYLQTEGTKNIVNAMKDENISRILSLSGGGLPYPEKDKPKIPDHLIRFIMKIAVPKILKDAKAHAKVLKESGLDWTIIRGPRLTEDEGKGYYRVGWVGVGVGTSLSREDLADFFIEVLEDDKFKEQMPMVSN